MAGKRPVAKKRKTARAAVNSAGKGRNPGRKNPLPDVELVADRTTPQAKLFPIVGIGASAGGLEAFTQLFDALPASTGMAFVLIQHMDPSKGSMLAEILGRTAKMRVVEIRNGMTVEPDHVYVLPPNADLATSDGKLSLHPRPETRGPHMPIDYFLRSLAADRQDRAIGVILSGTASDGTLGIRTIKAEGGITFAQTVKSAKYPGMPGSAISSGSIDFILPPEGIAEELARIGTHPYVAPAPGAKAVGAPESEDDFLRIFALLRDAHGVDFTHYKPATTRRRILRRMVLHRLERKKHYLQLLQERQEELNALFQDMLINVTSFFRDPEVFNNLKTKIFPKLVKEREPAASIRIWVPGCSTGEEAYSLAICLMEVLGEMSSTAPVQVFATDVNESALEKARAGIYPESIALDVFPERLQRFFSRTDSGAYQISKQIRETCIFAKQNLVKDPPFSQLDLISCRNVLIYMKPVLQKRVMPIFHYALKHSGYLVLGSSESISEYSDMFGAADRKNKIYYKKATMTRPTIDFGFPQFETDRAGGAKKGAEPVWSLENIQKDADNIVLSRFGPPGVIVNEHMEILQFRGDTSPFLSPAPGAASLNLMKMARDWIVSDIRLAVQQARKQGGPVRKKGIATQVGDRQMEVSVEIVPIRTPQSKDGFFLVLFEEETEAKAPEGEEAVPRKKTMSRERRQAQEQYIAQLETELVSTKEYLQAVIEEHEAANEELRSANEEIQSSNEELQSTNEELETAKEELQSTNEELTTVNEELANRNYELAQSNNDLVNFLAAVSIPIVMVGNDLRIRRFTPQAEKALNLIATDVGRPIGDIKPNISAPDLEQKIQDVISSFTTLEDVVRDREGRWHSMRIRPYKTTENRIEGAVVSLIDVDRYKSASEKLEAAVRGAQAIIDVLREPFVVLDGYLKVRSANQAFYDMFKVHRAETEGNFLYNLGDGQWNIPRLKDQLEQVLPRDSRVQDFDVIHDFPRVGPKTIRLNACRIESGEPGLAVIFLALADISELKRREADRQVAVDTVVQYLDKLLLVTVKWDPDGKVLRWSAQGEEMLGWKAAEVVGRSVAECPFMDMKDAEKVRSVFRELVTDGAPAARFRCRTVRRDGRAVECEWYASLFKDQEGHPVSIVTTLRGCAEFERTAGGAQAP
jgi:two-component system CheB/CheR fusion protein